MDQEDHHRIVRQVLPADYAQAVVSEGRLDATPFATRRFKLDEMMDAYDVFTDAANTNAMKVVISS